MNNLLDPTDTTMNQSEKVESKSYGDVPPPATPTRRASVDFRPISPLPERVEPTLETKANIVHSYNELPPPPPPPPPPLPNQALRRGSTDFRPISPLPEGRESTSDSKVLWV